MSLFIATIEPEETVDFFGEGETADKAFEDFIDNGEFNEYCYAKDIRNNKLMTVEIYKAIHKSDIEWDLDMDEKAEENEWQWVLGNVVTTKKVKYLEE